MTEREREMRWDRKGWSAKKKRDLGPLLALLLPVLHGVVDDGGPFERELGHRHQVGERHLEHVVVVLGKHLCVCGGGEVGGCSMEVGGWVGGCSPGVGQGRKREGGGANVGVNGTREIETHDYNL